MITESSTSIARPPDDVFAFVSDVRNDPSWHTDVLEAWLAGGAGVAAGSTFGVKFKPFMGQSEGTITVSQYEPPRRVVLQGHMGTMEPVVSFTVEPQGSGSRVTRRIEMKPRGMMRLMAPVMGGMFRKSNDGFVANLKRVLESG